MVISMIFNLDSTEIVKLAVENQSASFDGVVQYNYESGKLFGCSMSTGETENPANLFIEVFRLHKGENVVVFINSEECDGCDFYDAHHNTMTEDEMKATDRCIECCIDANIENGFEDGFEVFKEGVERQVRDLISDVVFEDLETLSKIRLEFFRHFAPARYNEELYNDSFESDVLDSLVEDAIDSEFRLLTAEEYLSGDADNIANLCDEIALDTCRTDSERELASKVAELLRDFKYDEALEVLE